jgi:hypothetical protein
MQWSCKDRKIDSFQCSTHDSQLRTPAHLVNRAGATIGFNVMVDDCDLGANSAQFFYDA